MSDRRRRLGQLGERLAADYLTQHGHRIVERNARRREGEIDLVTIDGDTLVFVEVKLRGAHEQGRAVESLSAAKQRRLAVLAEAYSADHPELPRDLRIDLVAIELDEAGRVASLDHVTNAVQD